MKTGDITTPLLRFLRDAEAAEALLDASDTQFARRTYIRALFAYIEGAVWILKYTCRNGRRYKSSPGISPGEYALLGDVSYDLKENGDVFEQAKFLRLPENLRFCVKMFNRLFGSAIDLKVGETNWQNFKQAIAIRHRITHPKHDTDFDISDAEIDQCKQTCLWFNQISSDAIHAVFDSSKRAMEELKKAEKAKEPNSERSDSPERESGRGLNKPGNE